MIFKSKTLVYDKQREVYTLPVWTLDTDNTVLTHIHLETLEQERFSFHTDHVHAHVRHLANYHPDRLQAMLDDGTIYSYLDSFDIRVTDLINAQAQIFMDECREYQAALELGKLNEVGRIGNNCRQNAAEAVYAAVVFV